MDTNIVGIVISVVYLGAILILSTLMKKKEKISAEGSRKFIHISVSFWWIIGMMFFTSPVWAATIPAIFILFNALSLKFKLVSAMESEKESRGFGTVYYAVSMTILAVFCFSVFSHPYIGAIGIFCMGLGDGFAAVIGKSSNGRRYKIFGSDKSILGNLTMFAFSSISIFIILSLFAPENAVSNALILASFATLLEAVSAKGLDNLTVPLGTSFMYQFFLTDSVIYPDYVYSFVIGLILTSLIVLITWKTKMLTDSGALAAEVSATAFYTFGGFSMWALLMLFFVSASVVGKIKNRLRPDEIDNVTAKTGARDAVQVIANSLPSLVLILLWRIFDDPAFAIGAIGAIAASNADTWASEIGSLSSKQPISITKLKPVEKGLSGGVTLLGTAASLGGSIFIALCALGLYINIMGLNLNVLFGFLIVIIIGFIGALIDSIIGDKFQAKYKCNVCLDFTEKRRHHNLSTDLVAGIRWIDNDMVNLLSGFFAASLCILVFNLIY